MSELSQWEVGFHHPDGSSCMFASRRVTLYFGLIQLQEVNQTALRYREGWRRDGRGGRVAGHVKQCHHVSQIIPDVLKGHLYMMSA